MALNSLGFEFGARPKKEREYYRTNLPFTRLIHCFFHTLLDSFNQPFARAYFLLPDKPLSIKKNA